MQFEQVAEGSVTLDEFVAQLSDEELAHLLGGQPNTGVANTFGFGNLPECGIPNFMTADGPAGLRILQSAVFAQQHGHVQHFLHAPGSQRLFMQ